MVSRSPAGELRVAVQSAPACWCGNATLAPFGSTYDRCPECGTLVSRAGFAGPDGAAKVEDFYGRSYWLTRQREELGFPDIYERARQDLSERCLHWLATLLTFRLPPARVLELGSGHGGRRSGP